ncbi:MAG: hypothetical protein HY342_13735 [Candidatus Lambdaproteobacteria bacterium]|nr:hypothetical protein [Candidatus Lambdaproteobacteria bacterium]
MTRSIILGLLLTVAVLIGLLLLFPATWVATIFVLLGLATAQVVLVRRHLRRVPPWEQEEAPPVPAEIGGAEVGGVGTSTATAAPGAVPQTIGSEAFSRFRAQLASAEKSLPSGTTGRPPPPPATPDDVQDRVQLSSGARGRGVTMQSLREPHPAERDSLEEDIFSDLRTDPGKLAPPPTPPIPKRPPVTVHADALEVLDEPAGGVTSEDSTTLLKLIDEALSRGDQDGARAGLQNYFAALAATPQAVDWRAQRAALRLAALERQPAKVTEAFELMLKAGYELAEEPFQALLDELLAGMSPGDAGPLRVSLLVRALAVFRQQNDRPAMDRLYRHIEEAQAGIGDEEKLVRFLKNHLEIKKVMQDLPGQLDIMDQIGNRLYRMGQTDAAREYYEQGLKLRAELEAREAADQEAAQTANTAGQGSRAADDASQGAAAPSLTAAATPADDASAEDTPPDAPCQRRRE